MLLPCTAQRHIGPDRLTWRICMPAEIPNLITVGQIAKRLGVETHRVAYVIRSRDIRPCGRAGIHRVFDDAAAERIGSELQRIQRAKPRLPVG